MVRVCLLTRSVMNAGAAPLAAGALDEAAPLAAGALDEAKRPPSTKHAVIVLLNSSNWHSELLMSWLKQSSNRKNAKHIKPQSALMPAACMNFGWNCLSIAAAAVLCSGCI